MKTMKKVLVTLCTLVAMSSLYAQTALEIAPQMVPGWNLGNTLEAPYYGDSELSSETSWQPTKTTQKVINYVKASGFRSVRIPCSWFIHMDEDYNISSVWMRRVKQVVDYCIKDSLYVMLNDHWDNGWIEVDGFKDLSEENVSQKAEILKKMWTQIATTFRDYDHHLLFAGMNEPNARDEATSAVLKHYQQTFVDAVRATGGNNTQRILVVQAPSTDVNASYEFDIRPDDPTPNAMMLEVHFYDPYRFIGMSEDQSWGKMVYYWGRNNHVEGSARNADSNEEESHVGTQMRKMYVKYASKGTPVIIGEYGGTWRNLGEGENQEKHDASIHDWYLSVTRYAINYGCVPMVWDTNHCGQPSGTVINRANCSIYNQLAMDGITEGVEAAKWPALTNDISKIENMKPKTERCYNLMGLLVDKNYRGLTVVDGKKIIRKYN
jgi:aryl-phospho-beta-D-glucosidase BglC (GH1 family)